MYYVCCTDITLSVWAVHFNFELCILIFFPKSYLVLLALTTRGFNKHTNLIWNTYFGMIINNLFYDKELWLPLSLKNARQVRTWSWLPQCYQPLLWCWVWLCCCYGNYSPAFMTAGSLPASRESWSRNAGTGWALPKQTLLSVPVSPRLYNKCRNLSWWHCCRDILTTNTVKHTGKHGTEYRGNRKIQ